MAPRLAVLLLLLAGLLAPLPRAWGEEATPILDEDVAVFTPYPLRPPSLESPRATLQSFIRNTNDAIELVRSEANRESIFRAVRRARLCLDLSATPVATREAVGTEKILLLKEILDRIELPPWYQIPNLAAVRERGLTSWTIPNTELTFEKVAEGPRQGAFLLSAHSVAQLEQFYALAKLLPYKPGASIGAYEDYLYGPGLLVSRNWLADLPSWAYFVFAEQTLWQWIGLFLLLALVCALTYLAYRAGNWWDARCPEGSVWLRVGRPLTAIFVMLEMQLLSLIVFDAINITGVPFIVVEFATEAITYLAAAWLAAIVIGRFGEGIISLRRLRPASLNSQLVRITTRLVAIVVVAYIGVVAAESFGVPVAPLIAGLGVGGLAIALAVRPTLENIVGGFILFADKPVRVGDFCAFGDKMGTVEEVGLRSTRIRALDRTLISVPNAEFANLQIVNWANCDSMLIDTVIGLRYETKPDQLRYVLTKLREMFFAHPKINQDSARIRFAGYGASSQDVWIRVYATTRDWNEFYAIREDVLLRVGEIVEQSGTGFAFPSQTVYLGRDGGLDKARSDSAMQEVEAWRREGRLPFPRMAPDHRKGLRNSLDFPPHGSPDEFKGTIVEKDRAEPLSRPAKKAPKRR